jgi:hypothetical protein
MSFRSPWRHRWYVWAVNAGRRVLRPFGRGEEAFIAWLARRQNGRVARHLAKVPARRALLIMPRCVKKTGCHVDVQHGLDECLACMGCPLGDVAQVCRRHDVEALVAFRSHIAFEMARTLKPDVIIASACHDRMVKALRNVPEVPALLAPLAGMDRMCVNATLDLAWLEQQVAAAAAGRAVSDGPGAAPLPVGSPVPSVPAS